MAENLVTSSMALTALVKLSNSHFYFFLCTVRIFMLQ